MALELIFGPITFSTDAVKRVVLTENVRIMLSRFFISITCRYFFVFSRT